MCAGHTRTILARVAVAILCCVRHSASRTDVFKYAASIRLNSGWVGTNHTWVGDNEVLFASFRGVPYAKQPLGELRFQELQAAEPWDYTLDATENGPVCPQTDVLYERYFGPKDMSEACIHANIHVPLHALPENPTRLVRDIQSPYPAAHNDEVVDHHQGLPILVFIHGGGFAFGSGDDDLYGPEHFIGKDVIVVTFNYRLGSLGYLSLNSSYIPGNNGLRDAITLLHWVKTNARAFGGDADDVTLAGQSAGSVMTHLLTLSKAAEGLFKRAIIMSGVAVHSFFTTSPLYARYVADKFLAYLNITSSNPEEIHKQLVDMPIDDIVQSNGKLLDELGLFAFSPVQEYQLPGVTTIIDDDPMTLIQEGRGDDIPIIFGFSNVEAETFRYRFKEVNLLERFMVNPIVLTPLDVLFTKPMNKTALVIASLSQRYFGGTPSEDGLIKWMSDINFVYPTLKSAQLTAARKGAPVFLYEFSYNPDVNIIKGQAKFNGSGHIEDLTYIFKTHSKLYPDSSSRRDQAMSEWMTTLFTNFIKYSSPTGAGKELRKEWPPLGSVLKEQVIDTPGKFQYLDITPEQQDLLRFGNGIFETNSST